MATKLPKAEQAVIAAHEAGMHDKKPTPEVCKRCRDDASAQRAFAGLLDLKPEPIRTRKPRAAKPAPEKPKRKPKVAHKPDKPEKATGPDGETLIAVGDPEGPDGGWVPEHIHSKDCPCGPGVEVIDAKGETVPPVYTSREAWLMAAVEGMTPWFTEAGYDVPAVRVSVGWPAGRSAKSNTIGQCWYTVEDSVPALFISPVLTDPVEVLATLIHEVAHAVTGPTGQPHRGLFVKVAKAVGLEGKWTATVAGEDLKAKLTALADRLGVYTHAKVMKGVGRKVQTTRMLKVQCPDCGCVARMTKKWLVEVGPPICSGCMAPMKEVA